MRRLDVCLRCLEGVILRAKFVAAENEDAISSAGIPGLELCKFHRSYAIED
jgi:hypothetical protein